MTTAEAETVWNTAVAKAVRAAAGHPLDSRFSNPERWPGYFLVRQRALASGSGSVARAGASPARAYTGLLDKARGTERRLEARGGRLVGRPDHFDGTTLTEYKSSLPNPAWAGANSLLDAFRRQLRLYAAIIAEATGVWPARGRVIAASGQVMDVPLDPAACDAEADAALAALDALNQELASGTAPETLARPAPAACNGCPFRAICPAFWRWLGSACVEEPWEVAAEGVLEGFESGQDGDLYTAHLALHSATHQLEVQQPLVLRRSAHGDLTASRVGEHWRIVSARVRSVGRLRADLSTVVFAVSVLPILASGADGTGAGVTAAGLA